MPDSLGGEAGDTHDWKVELRGRSEINVVVADQHHHQGGPQTLSQW
ncbi:MAG: hypothetical protein ACYC8T_20905 [Myxococcaceae bacterium]